MNREKNVAMNNRFVHKALIRRQGKWKSIFCMACFAGGLASAVADTPIEATPLLKGFVHQKVNFTPGQEYNAEARKFQGIPTIARTPGGRLWAVWYAGPATEDRYNYLVAVTSEDNGRTWSDVRFVVDPDGDGPKRAADPCLWLDPEGRLWLFWWLQSKEEGISVTMAMNTADPDASESHWCEPRPLFPGVMLNKPIVSSAGEWLAPAAIWKQDNGSMVMVSRDTGRSWALRGAANVPQDRRNCDEHMLVEKRDGTLWMLVRTANYGIAEATSGDQGRTWSEMKDFQRHTTSRFFIGRLKSGHLLLIRHGKINERGSRTDLMAYLSFDDGATWQGGLLLDDRPSVSYPDAVQGDDGTIYAIHDWARYDNKEITFTAFTEQDILAGDYISTAARKRTLVNRATGINPKPRMQKKISVPLRMDAAAESLMIAPGAKFNLSEKQEQVFKADAKLFSNRNHKLAEPPKKFRNRHFVVAPIEGLEVICTEPGIAYIFTPQPDRNRDSAVEMLLKQGFSKTSEPEFILFKRTSPSLSEACTIYQKKCKTGERIKFGKWGVLVY